MPPYPHASHFCPSLRLSPHRDPCALPRRPRLLGATAAFGAGGREVSWLHRDHLGSVRAITRVNATTGAVEVVEKATYKPFGEQSDVITATALPAAPETKGWIGERFDADAGLKYLNARYYDPVLGMFLQPDWWEVTKAGVGTNRYSYSFNDPINMIDPNGNEGTALYEAMQGDDESEDAYRHNLKEAEDRLNRLRELEGDPLMIQKATEDVEWLCWALLHKSAEGGSCPFPGQTYPATSVMGVPRAVKPFRTATRTWNSAT